MIHFLITRKWIISFICHRVPQDGTGWIMRRWILEILAACLMVSCSAIDVFEPSETLGTGRPRSKVLVSEAGRRGHEDSTENQGTGFRKDTVLYVSALEFPEGYDWHRDSAYLGSGASIVLYRNGERVMTIPTGAANAVGTGADMHHIIQGHIVTEYCGSAGTVVKLDGKEIFRSPQTEYIKGLLMDGDRLVSLTQRKNGKGFVYRCGDSVVMERSIGELIGALGTDNYFSSGALYQDKGNVCFAYRSPDNAVLVEDGVERAVPCKGDLLDLRRIGGSTCLLESDGDRLLFTVGDRSRNLGSSFTSTRRGCHISVSAGEPVALCLFDSKYGTSTSEIHQVDRAIRKLMGIHTLIPSEDGLWYISHAPSQWLSITGPEDRTVRHETAYLWMGVQACCYAGHKVVVGATPYGAEAFPEIIRGEKRERLEVNGFITGVSSVINHPS